MNFQHIKGKKRGNFVRMIIFTLAVFLGLGYLFPRHSEIALESFYSSSQYREDYVKETNHGDTRAYKYSTVYKQLLESTPLHLNLSTVNKLRMENVNFINLHTFDTRKIVFVTAASHDHFNESLDGIASIQTFFPEYPIIYFDLGLERQDIDILQSVCSVSVRRVDFSRHFPAHVNHLKTYAWKPIVIQTIFEEYGGVIWVDASVRFMSSNIKPLLTLAKKNGGIVLPSRGYHSNYAVTHPALYKYLPTDTRKQKSVEQLEANFMLIFRTKRVYKNIFFWLVACSLEKDCIAPIDNLHCDFSNGIWKYYASCHRFDQSTLNILLSNFYNYDIKKYRVPMKGIARIQRSISHDYDLKWC